MAERCDTDNSFESAGSIHSPSKAVVEDVVAEEAGRDDGPSKDSSASAGLNRGLSERHIAMITLGGVMGSGLFIGSGQALNTAGPGGSFVAYAMVSIVIYFTMASLGELATYLPIPGSFNAYGGRFIDPAFGFALSWNYWLNWVTVVAYEAGAVAMPISYWLPNVHFAVWGVIMILLVFAINSISVKGYGEAEFWFALIKILAVLMFIIVAIIVASGGLGGHRYGFELWHYKEGPFVAGFGGLINTFIQAGFSMQGSELVGVTAAESRNPSKHIPRATRQIFIRLVFFFVLTILLMGLVIEYDDPMLVDQGSDASLMSPFTILFLKAGIKPAAHIINAVMVISSISACSSGMYAACRTTHLMAVQGMAPKLLRRTTRRGVPLFALIFCILFTFFLWAFNFVGQGVVFDFLTGISGVTGYLAWAAICIVHIRFRMAWKVQGHSLDELRYRAFAYPFGPVFCLVLIAVIVFGQAYPSFQFGFDAVTFFSSFLELPLFAIFYLGWKYWFKTKLLKLSEIDLVSGARAGVSREEELAMDERSASKTLKERAIDFFVHICG